MHSCNHNREDLVLRYYGELDEAAAQEVSARLLVCPSCSHYYAGLADMEAVFPRTPSVDPDETVMAAIRSATSNRVQHLAGRRARQRVRWGGIFAMPVLPGMALAMAVMVVSFFLGRMTQNTDSFLDSVTEGRLPGVTEISDIAYNAESGLVSVQFRTASASSVEGSIDSAPVRALLEHALTDVENPASRLRAAKTLAAVDADRVVPDPNLVAALGAMLNDESNVGMKIQTVKALRKISSSNPLSEELTTVLMDLLETNRNSALRMEVLEFLTESEMARQELTRMLTRAVTDENSFIRLRAQSELDDLGVSQRLEQLND